MQLLHTTPTNPHITPHRSYIPSYFPIDVKVRFYAQAPPIYLSTQSLLSCHVTSPQHSLYPYNYTQIIPVSYYLVTKPQLIQSLSYYYRSHSHLLNPRKDTIHHVPHIDPLLTTSHDTIAPDTRPSPGRSSTQQSHTVAHNTTALPPSTLDIAVTDMTRTSIPY